MPMQDYGPRSSALAIALALLLALPWGCSVLSDVELRAGLGKPCTSDADCQNASCYASPVPGGPPNGICARDCAASAECPMGTICADRYCQVPRRVGVTLPMSVQPTNPADAATYLSVKSHSDGIAKASRLPYVTLEQQFAPFSGNAIEALRELATRNDIVIGHTQEFLPNLNLLARELPDHFFIGVNSGTYYDLFDRQPNLITVWDRREEVWYIAGRLAGTAAISRVGVIAAGITPDSVRNVNAFALGARRSNPSVKVEVRYIGALADTSAAPTYDYKDAAGMVIPPKLYREELLARQLTDSGCEFIADMSGNQRAMKYTASVVNPGRLAISKKLIPVLVSGLGAGCTLDSGQIESTTCIGAIFDRWEYVYRAAIETAHRGRVTPGMAIEQALTSGDTAVGVQINTMFTNGFDIDALVGDYADELLLKPVGRRVFVGPFAGNGQRDADDNGIPDENQSLPSGQALSDTEVATMCFYVDGVVEPYDTGRKDAMMQPILEERRALVPGGLVPGATAADGEAPLPIPGDRLAIPSRQSTSCRKNARWIYRTNG